MVRMGLFWEAKPLSAHHFPDLGLYPQGILFSRDQSLPLMAPKLRL